MAGGAGRRPTVGGPGSAARGVALDALRRIDGGAYANLVLPALLERSSLDERDRHLVTALTYGTTRRRASVDHLVQRHLRRGVDAELRRVLRLGAYELAFLRTPPHAAVSQAVAQAPAHARGFVNAVLRRVAGDVERGVSWPDVATELSYPAWVVSAFEAVLGATAAEASLRQMNVPAEVVERADGYIQDEASQWVAALVGAEADELVLDLCAAPGGKATALAATGARVVAVDSRPGRAGLVAGNAERVGAALAGVVAADGRAPPFRPAMFDRVLVDAPCSGLGVLRRRPDARWRVQPTDVTELARLQHQLLEGATVLLRPGGLLTYSVCTLTMEETAVDLPGWEALAPPAAPWEPWGRGARLLPHVEGTDGMYVLRVRSPG